MLMRCTSRPFIKSYGRQWHTKSELSKGVTWIGDRRVCEPILPCVPSCLGPGRSVPRSRWFPKILWLNDGFVRPPESRTQRDPFRTPTMAEYWRGSFLWDLWSVTRVTTRSPWRLLPRLPTPPHFFRLPLYESQTTPYTLLSTRVCYGTERPSLSSTRTGLDCASIPPILPW